MLQRCVDYPMFIQKMKLKPLIGNGEFVQKMEEKRKYILLEVIPIEDYNSAYKGDKTPQTEAIKYLCHLTNPSMVQHISTAITRGICTNWQYYNISELNPSYTFITDWLQKMQAIVDRYDICYHTRDKVELIIKDAFGNYAPSTSGWYLHKILMGRKSTQPNPKQTKYTLLIDLLHLSGGGTHRMPHVLYLGYTFPNVQELPRQTQYVEGMREQDILKLSKAQQLEELKFLNSIQKR